jgi:hypothetical protein
MTQGDVATLSADSRQERSMIYLPGTYDVFISHSWRYDDEWTAMVALLDKTLGARWRNWSLPWHDPGLDRFTPSGHAELLQILDGQISVCRTVLVLADVCKGQRGDTWVRIEIDLAKKYGKPVFGIGHRRDGGFPRQFREEMAAIVPWSQKSIVPLLEPIGSDATHDLAPNTPARPTGEAPSGWRAVTGRLWRRWFAPVAG